MLSSSCISIVSGENWITWKPTAYNVRLLVKSNQYIHRKVTQIHSQKSFYSTVVYGRNHEQQREQLWLDLQQPSQNISEAWCIMGDFNSILYKEDKIGSNEVTEHEIQELTSFMEDYDGLYKWPWNEVFNYTIVKYLTNGLSDHTPMLIQFLIAPKPTPQFQYCDMWSSQSDFHSIITSMLPTLSSTHNMKNLCNLALIKQQCKITQGDECLRFFFTKAKQRKLATYIYTIHDAENIEVEGFEKVGKVMLAFYTKLLGHPSIIRRPIDKEIIEQGPVLSQEQLTLCKPFTHAEIKEVIFSIPNIKSPGPDGFGSGFFKTTEPETGPLVCVAIQDFFTKGLQANLHKSQIVLRGCLQRLHDQCMLAAGLQLNWFPLTYLGVLITVSRLTKLECSRLVGQNYENAGSYT
ncbi:LOW QUALITY PROTEIN: hypothetical protein Cgig2_023463 [Carnegiea gigantea]|uniref:Reverse transcriptase n=1 Tax=Carnegiea gigantea TaxID=171969 RepID=A0A9Q1K6N2_9CARY|nr:LOW QUALITY PROTEIN: hypothetical protein Cgig2_023463 [Carnegiea gigantea]